MTKVIGSDNALANAVKTFYNVNHLENAKNAFEAKKEEIKKKFKEEKKAIDDLTDDGIITLKVEIKDEIEILLSQTQIPKNKEILYKITFEDNKIKIKSEVKSGNISRIDIILRQAYNYREKEFVFIDDANNKFDIFESVMELISRDVLRGYKGNITII